MAILQCGSTVLPAPTSISIDDEIIWSESTGRTMSGKMLGDVVAQKKNVSIAWGILSQAQFNIIKNNLVAGFFPISINIGETISITSYRSTLKRECLGEMTDGTFYYKSASVQIIQQ